MHARSSSTIGLLNPLVVIIGISSYSEPLPAITEDIRRIKALCKALKYQELVVNENEAIADKRSFQELLEKARGRINWLHNNDGLLFFYSGHGSEDCLILSNGDEFPWNDVFEFFNGKRNHCPYLVNYPKIFVLDCCRGEDNAYSVGSSNNQVIIMCLII